MTDQLPGRTPLGTGGVDLPRPAAAARPSHPVRIGDAERDEALNKLGDHYAAGRLTREELDERSESALGARFDSDLEPLFHDLPAGSRGTVAPGRRLGGSSGSRRPSWCSSRCSWSRSRPRSSCTARSSSAR